MVTPRKPRCTRPLSISSLTIGWAVSIEIARPMPSAFPRMTAVVIPTTSPLRSTSGPPELPGLMAASVWMAFGMETSGLDSWMRRPSALTTPLVTVGPPEL